MVVKIINKKPDDQELKTLCHNSKVGGELNFSTSHAHRTTLDIVYKVKVASCVKLPGLITIQCNSSLDLLYSNSVRFTTGL